MATQPKPDAVKANNSYIVAKDRTPNNGLHNYDTPYEIARSIAAAALAKGDKEFTFTGTDGKARTFPIKGKTLNAATQDALAALININNLKDINGKDCEVDRVHIEPGWPLIIPENLTIKQPRQASLTPEQCKELGIPYGPEPLAAIAPTPAPAAETPPTPPLPLSSNPPLSVPSLSSARKELCAVASHLMVRCISWVAHRLMHLLHSAALPPNYAMG